MINSLYINNIRNINTFISEESIISPTATILMNSIILGKSHVKDNCVIGPNTIIVDSVIEEGSIVINSFINNSYIGKNTTVGPFAHLRENAIICDDCKIGNFVEVKKSSIGNKSKASHLAYIGDSEIGVNCNFGCGSITVNYDGIKKHKTTIRDNVFIGCNTNLVAPVTIHDNSFIACGSTITTDVPPKTLAIARSRQLNKINYYK